MAKIPSCHIDEPFTEDIEARYEYRSQMDLRATQFKLSVARQCKKYAQACDRVNQRKRHKRSGAMFVENERKSAAC